MSLSQLFPTTDWSQVRQATSQDPERVRAAVSLLCHHYRDAICEWFRKDARTREEAEDLTHDFLMRWLARDAPLGRFERGEQRFRDFLGSCLRYFVRERYSRSTRLKRGGGAVHETFMEETMVTSVAESVVEGPDLELARHLFRSVWCDLRERWGDRLRGPSFDRLCDRALEIGPGVEYAEIARELGLPVGTVKGWIFRLRQDFYDGFRLRVRPLVVPEEVPDELRYLLDLLLKHGVGVDGEALDRRVEVGVE